MKQFTLLALSLLIYSNLQADDAPDYRLPANIHPLTQNIHLRLDPSQENYSGTTEISLRIDKDVDAIAVNQVGLEFQSISLSSAEGDRELSAADGEWEMAWLSDGSSIAPGEYSLHIEFSGQYAVDGVGMHRATFEGNDYVFTQMESMYARRAFPLFDEPSFKIPYQVTISAPEDLVVVSNTPVETETNADGWKRVEFMETPPLPSYLIAYAVGPLDRAELEGMSVPGYVYTPKGHADEVGFVLRETPNIVAKLEEYFDLNYPYRKLDFIAVPDFAFGAMENPGLITYRTDLMMVGDELSGNKAISVLNVIAHEVAHIWYGDLVTMAWWDDLWLNEAFATWMANRILEHEYPQYESNLNLPQTGAFAADQLTTTKAIRKTVRNEEEIFDGLGLNYSKGHSILRMLENYVGPEVWQRAIQTYVRKFSWGNATEKDLWAVVAEESGMDIGKIAGDYLNQPGFATISIDADGAVTQKRYLLQGAKAEDLLWHLPLNVKYKADGNVRQSYMLLDKESGTLDVPGNTDWIFPDAGGNGYYRWKTDLDQFYNLVDDIDELSAREKIALLDNSDALLNAGEINLFDHMFVLNRLLTDSHPLVFLPALEGAKQIGEVFVTDSNRAAFSRFVDQSMSERFESVGMLPKPGEDETVGQMRPRLVRTLGQFGTDETLIEAAAELVEQYFDDPASVPSGLAVEAMRVTALHDDGSRYEQYKGAYLASESADQKSNILAAVYFKDPEIVLEHFEFSLGDEVQAGDSMTALNFTAYVLDDDSIVYEWLEENIDAVVAKAPSFNQQFLPQITIDNCDPVNLERGKSFFADRGDIYATSLAKAVESTQACIDYRSRHMEDFEKFLEQY